jgi:hypothetical protein
MSTQINIDPSGWFRQGKPRWLWPYIISLLMMTLGFLIRLPLSSDPSSLGAYIGQNMVCQLSLFLT